MASKWPPSGLYMHFLTGTVCTNVCMGMYVCIGMYVCMYLCMHVCMYSHCMTLHAAVE